MENQVKDEGMVAQKEFTAATSGSGTAETATSMMGVKLCRW